MARQAIAEQSGDQRHDLVHPVLQTVERHHRENQRRTRTARRCTADDVVAQQRGGDDPRRQLSAGHLDRHEQRAEREDQERQRQRDDRLVERRAPVTLSPVSRHRATRRATAAPARRRAPAGSQRRARSRAPIGVAGRTIDVVPDERPLESLCGAAQQTGLLRAATPGRVSGGVVWPPGVSVMGLTRDSSNPARRTVQRSSAPDCSSRAPDPCAGPRTSGDRRHATGVTRAARRRTRLAGSLEPNPNVATRN